MSRLVASPRIAGKGQGAAVPYQATCTECGRSYTAPTLRTDFCSSACRKAWNNRRAVRGAELYDLFMALRFDRATAKRLHVWKAMCRRASGFRAEDVVERKGRLSWRAPATILARRAYLLATTIAGGR